MPIEGGKKYQIKLPNYDDELRKIVSSQMSDARQKREINHHPIKWLNNALLFFESFSGIHTRIHTRSHPYAVITHDLEHFIYFFSHHLSFWKNKATELNRKVIILHEVFGDQEKFQTQNTNISCSCDVCTE